MIFHDNSRGNRQKRIWLGCRDVVRFLQIVDEKGRLQRAYLQKTHNKHDYLRHDYRRWDVLLALLRGDYWHRSAKLWDLPDAYPYRYPERFRIHAWRMSEKCGLDTIGAQFGLSSKTFGIL